MKPDLEAIKRRCEATTRGEWKVIEKGNTVKSLAVVSVACDGLPQLNICSGISPKTHDADFIAHARTDIPALLDYIAELENRERSRIEHEEKILKKYGFTPDVTFANLACWLSKERGLLDSDNDV